MILIIIVGYASFYGGVLLHQIAVDFDLPRKPYSSSKTKTFVGLMEVSMGFYAMLFGSFLVLFVDMFATVGTLIAAGEALHSGLPVLTYAEWLCVSLAFLIPVVCARSHALLSYVSIVGVVFFLSLLSLIVVFGAICDTDQCPHKHQGAVWPPSNPLRSSGLLLAPGIIKFSFAGHESFPSLAQSLVEPRHWPKALFFAMLGMALFSAAIGGAGWAVFGDAENVNLLLNLPMTTFGRVVRVVAGAMLVAGVPILLLAAFEVLECDLWPLFEQWRRNRSSSSLNDDEKNLFLDDHISSELFDLDATQDQEQESTATKQTWKQWIAVSVERTLLTLATVALAIRLPNLGLVLSVTGLLGDTMLGILLCVFMMWSFRPTIKRTFSQMWQEGIIFLIGVVMLIGLVIGLIAL